MNFTDIFQRGLDEFFPFDEWAEVVIRIGIKIWNYAILSIVSLLQLDLETYAGGAGMDFARSIHTVFLSVSAPLLVVIFFWHVYELSYEDRKQGSDFWSILSTFYPLVIGEALLTYSIDIVAWVFRLGFYLVKSVTSFSIDSLMIDETVIVNDLQNNQLGASDAVGGILLLLLSFFTVIVILVCVCLLFYIVYFRYIKLYALLPFSSLAFVTYVGPQEFKRIATMYFKYILALALESVAMLISIILCNVLITGTISNGIGGIVDLFLGNNFAILVSHLLIIIFNCAMTVGACKGSEMMIERWLVH